MKARIAAGAARIEELTGIAAERWRARVLSAAEPNRFVAEYSAESRPGRPPDTFVAKFFANDSGRWAFDAMRAVGGALKTLPGSPALALPEAVEYHADDRILLMLRAKGTHFDTSFPPGDPYVLAGRALATLHALEIDLGTPKTLGDHVAELIRPEPGELADRYPARRGLIEETLDRILREEAGWSAVPSVPIHRDYQLRQLLLDADRVSVVDWDLLACGDPAFDVAYFLVYLETHLADAHLHEAQKAFTRGYSRCGQPGVLARAETYRRFNLLRRACRRYRRRDAGWEYELTMMLERLARSNERRTT